MLSLINYIIPLTRIIRIPYRVYSRHRNNDNNLLIFLYMYNI